MSRKIISKTEVNFVSATFLDDSGRLFTWNGGVYRAISHQKEKFFRDLIQNKVLNDLYGTKIIPTSIASISLDGYELTLKHEKVSFVTSCTEWTHLMYKDAAVLYCDLAIELDKRGLGIKDAHPWNILFRNGRPIFIDFGSITSAAVNSSFLLQEFQARFILPMLLISGGLAELARENLKSSNPISTEATMRILLGKLPLYLWISYTIALFNLRIKARIDWRETLLAVKDFVCKIRFDEVKTEWSDYLGPGSIHEISELETWDAKSKSVWNVLNRIKPESVLDIGCNRGWFSEMANRLGCSVMAIDIDETNLNRIYELNKNEGRDITFALMDIGRPTMGYDFCFPSADQRFKSDLVLALGLTHHLVFKRGLTFEFIALRLAQFSTRWLLVEFVPPSDKFVSEWASDQTDWYCLDEFVVALERYFEEVELMQSSPDPRVLVLCQKSANNQNN